MKHSSKLIGLVFAMMALAGGSLAQAQFSGDFDPMFWTLENSGGSDGSVDWTAAPGQVTLTGGNSSSGTFGSTDLSITINQAGTLSYDWSYFSTDDPGFDDAFEINEMGRTFLADTSGASGTRSIQVVAGEAYGFAVETDENGFGPGVLTIANFNFVPDGPANDNWDLNGLDLGFSFFTTANNVGATVQKNEQDLDNTGSTLWWYFEAPESGNVTINTFGSDFDTVLHVYTDANNGFGNFTLVASNDQAGGGDQSQVTFSVTQGQRYEVRVGGYTDGGPVAEGSISLSGFATPPDNDNFENTIDLGFPFNTTGSNGLATVEKNEQDLEITGSTVWWFFQAPETGTVTINTFGSDFDTVLHVYTGWESGLGVGDLILVAENDQVGGGDQSEVTFEVTAGEFYEVRVGGYTGGGPAAEGNIVLNGFASPPANDNLLNTPEISLPFVTTATNVLATVEEDEPDVAITGATVWWGFEAPASGKVQIDLAGSDFDAILLVYKLNPPGQGFADLELVAERIWFELPNPVTIDVEAGEIYLIRVGGFTGGNTTGTIELKVSDVYIPGDANDDGGFDFGDIEAFFIALTDPAFYATLFPQVDPDLVLDFDGDGTVNFGDIEGFFNALTGG